MEQTIAQSNYCVGRSHQAALQTMSTANVRCVHRTSRRWSRFRRQTAGIRRLPTNDNGASEARSARSALGRLEGRDKDEMSLWNYDKRSAAPPRQGGRANGRRGVSDDAAMRRAERRMDAARPGHGRMSNRLSEPRIGRTAARVPDRLQRTPSPAYRRAARVMCVAENRGVAGQFSMRDTAAACCVQRSSPRHQTHTSSEVAAREQRREGQLSRPRRRSRASIAVSGLVEQPGGHPRSMRAAHQLRLCRRIYHGIDRTIKYQDPRPSPGLAAHGQAQPKLTALASSAVLRDR